MKAEAVIATIERFFLDVIGSVIPGSFFLGGLWIVLGRPRLEGLGMPPENGFDWTALVAVSYVSGHLVGSLGRAVHEPLGRLASGLRTLWSGFGRVLPKSLVSQKELLQEIADGSDFQGFVDTVGDRFPRIRPGERSAVFPARNLAISLVPEHQHRVFRFMFLSLLNFGAATAIVLVVVTWMVLSLLVGLDWLSLPGVNELGWGWVLLWLLVALPLVERGCYFRSIAYRVPFSMGAIAILQGALKEAEGEPVLEATGAPPRIYLAGGFYSGWQDRVSEIWEGELVDPRGHRLEKEEEFTFWDLEAIRASDWVVAYLEKTNPGGYALALEVGFAKALGKRVILVDEKSQGDARLRRKLGMVWATADVTFDDFEKALEFLRTFEGLEGST